MEGNSGGDPLMPPQSELGPQCSPLTVSRGDSKGVVKGGHVGDTAPASLSLILLSFVDGHCYVWSTDGRRLERGEWEVCSLARVVFR